MKFRKKPVVIDAIQFTGPEVVEELRDFCGDAFKGVYEAPGGDHWAHIGTLEDGNDGQAKHFASIGDWIIKGVKGEFYPCKQDIFALTYEPDTGNTDSEGDAFLAHIKSHLTDKQEAICTICGRTSKDIHSNG